MPRYAPVGGDFAECDLCGSSRHLCLSIPVYLEEKENITVCIMCAKKIAKAYTRFVATVKSRSYSYWYNERRKMKKAKISSGLETKNSEI
jgi:uncharacterized protein CbrC (UPF0167 family)